jgi:hypothetical protein
MSSSIKRAALAYIDAVKNPVTRSYLLEKNLKNKPHFVLIDNWQWKFIEDGIVTIQLQKALDQREVYLVLEPQQYLNCTPNERADAIFQGNVIFENQADLTEFCGQNNTEIIQSLLVE